MGPELQRRRWRRHLWVTLACVVLFLPALLDLPQLAALGRRAEHTIDAVFAVLGVLIVAGLVQRWSADRQAERDELRYREIVKVVFRTLSQTVNDAYRIQAAPILGLSLHQAGIPGFTDEEHRENLALLAQAGLQPTDRLPTGFWHERYSPEFDERLSRLTGSPGFAEHMFQQCARARRLLQQAFTQAASVAIAVPRAAEELADIAEVADELVRSQEGWRRAALSPGAGTAAEARAAICCSLTATNAALMRLQPRADLPAGRVDLNSVDVPPGPARTGVGVPVPREAAAAPHAAIGTQPGKP